MTDWIFFGHSHVAALEKGWPGVFAGSDPSANRGHFFTIDHDTFQEYFSVREGQAYLSESIIQKFESIIKNAESICMVLVLAGNDHSIIGLAKAQHDYQIGEAEAVVEAKGGEGQPPQVLSEDLIRGVFNERLAGVEDLLPQLCERFDLRTMLLESPPPLADEKSILSHPGVFGELLSQYGVSAANTRARLWALQNQLMKKFAEQNQIEFVTNPAEIFDADGFLAEEYSGNDPTHGNDKYGSAVLQQLTHNLGLNDG